MKIEMEVEIRLDCARVSPCNPEIENVQRKSYSLAESSIVLRMLLTKSCTLFLAANEMEEDNG